MLVVESVVFSRVCESMYFNLVKQSSIPFKYLNIQLAPNVYSLEHLMDAPVAPMRRASRGANTAKHTTNSVNSVAHPSESGSVEREPWQCASILRQSALSE